MKRPEIRLQSAPFSSPSLVATTPQNQRNNGAWERNDLWPNFLS